MEEKKKMYEHILYAWEVMKKFGFKPLSDEKWEELIGFLNISYKKADASPSGRFLKGLLQLVTKYYEDIEKEERNGKDKS